ncbi:SHOCT domain-containing protein [Natronobacterium texcoconense]|uniref:Uncharacterized membrane protein n=1 Tax=Natronobacterium texcoconense TaxID=1095778 RepID=A0A1H1I3U5_NATTX|nr:SHOCT domain-containing protein [Natronobacterium texcoconense]SDR32377.1 Uncharacterized membrane protein [Natronobacterium texcoconense]
MNDGSESFFEMLTAITATATLPLGILAAVFLGFPAAAAVFVTGWLLLVPVFAIASDYLGSSGHEIDEVAQVHERVTSHSSEHSTDTDRPSSDDPLETLRARYARGEIDDLEFERRLEQLVATEDGPEAVPGGTLESTSDGGSPVDADDDRIRER